MKGAIFNFLQNHKNIILYLIFGVLTTLINIILYWLLSHIVGFGTLPASIVAWIMSVTFAFVTNKIFVFQSRMEIRKLLFEIGMFFACRLLSGVFDCIFMFIFVEKLQLNDMVVKTSSNIIVVILNYIASKFVIFR